MNPSLIMSFVVTMMITALLIPVVIRLGKSLGIVAHKNKRTVHKIEVPRICNLHKFINGSGDFSKD